MAIDWKHSYIDARTGIVMDSLTGMQVGLAPPPIMRVTKETVWPQWVVPHKSHVMRIYNPDNDPPVTIAVPGFDGFYVNRWTAEISVLVNDEKEKERALSPK